MNRFPILTCYAFECAIHAMWSREKFKIMADRGVNLQRAGELAAAKIAAETRLEMEALSAVVRFLSEDDTSAESVALAHLYDELQILPGVYGDLMDMSGSRTMIVDELEYLEKGRD